MANVKNAHESVLEGIKEYIMEHKLSAGDKLPTERELSAMLSKSRHSVREALKALEALNVVQTVQGSGTYLNDPTFSFLEFPFSLKIKNGTNIQDLIVARETVETKIVSIVCEKITDEEVAQLEQFLEMRSTEEFKNRYSGRFDFEFEQLIGEICANEFLSMVQKLTHYMWVHAVKESGVKYNQNINDVEREHKAIFEAIRNRDSEQASQATLAHLNAVYEVIDASQREMNEQI
ncbi:MAG: FadR family transcriptional regulator [Christensenellaceae bacterium]|nr:FadR family transcriptional regulator [Christensenellaceae bacterium]